MSGFGGTDSGCDGHPCGAASAAGAVDRTSAAGAGAGVLFPIHLEGDRRPWRPALARCLALRSAGVARALIALGTRKKGSRVRPARAPRVAGA